MTQTRKKIAIVSCNAVIEFAKKNRFNIIPDDWLIKDSLKELVDVDVEIIDWQKTSDSKKYDAIYISSAWDAHHHQGLFQKWLKSCESDGRKRLINDSVVLKLGNEKDVYLSLLLKHFSNADTQHGAIIPTVFINHETKPKSLAELLKELQEKNPKENWSGDLVMKPIISADGDNTFRFTNDQEAIKADKNNCILPLSKMEEKLSELVALTAEKKQKGVMLQPYMTAVKDGEYQLVFVNKTCVHATIKTNNKFENVSFEENIKTRREIPLGELPTNMLSYANEIMRFLNEQYPNMITRARVDLFYDSKKGSYVCEVELVDPNTNINCLSGDRQKTVIEFLTKAIVKKCEQLKEVKLISAISGEVVDGERKSAATASFFVEAPKQTTKGEETPLKQAIKTTKKQ